MQTFQLLLIIVKDLNEGVQGDPTKNGEDLKKMKFEYTITKEGGEAEIMKAMSWKKLFKSLLLKYPEFSGWCTYINKKGHIQVRNFNNGKETKKL